MKRLFAFTLILSILVSLMTGCAILEKLFDSGDIEITGPVDDIHNLLPLPPEWDGLEVINSIDKLNYYTALYVLGEPSDSVQIASLGNVQVSLLAHGTDDGQKQEQSTDSAYPEEPSGSDNTSDNQGTSTSPGVSDTSGTLQGVYYYSLSPNDVFSFNKISMFQIELTDPDGFLASILGLGTVDVVISENCIWDDSLITFRNGERFFSCLANGCGYDQQTGNSIWEFSTHKFISGFYIVKNIEQENYKFNVEVDREGQVISFTCTEFKAGGPRADRDVKITSATVFSTDGGSFTAAELDQYFKSKKPTDENSQTQDSSQHLLDLNNV